MATDVDQEDGIIKSFIFLDTEASGLFPVEAMNPLDDPPIPGSPRDPSQLLLNHIRLTSSCQAPYVMEISLLLATRNAFLAGIRKIDSLTQDDDQQDSGSSSKAVFKNFRIPYNVYTAQVKPKMSCSEWADYEKGRRQNYVFSYSQEELKDKNDFAMEWKVIKLLLEQSPKPSCIIAHNGLRFDFRVLHAEFERNDLLSSSPIPDQVYFLDSYLAFLDLEKRFHDDLRCAVRLLDWGALSAQIKNESTLLSLPEETVPSPRSGDSISETTSDDVCDTSATVQVQVQAITSPATSRSGSSSDVSVGLRSASTSAASSPEKPLRRPARRRLFAITTDDHPLNFLRTTSWSPAKKKRVRPNLFERSTEGDWVFNSHFSVAYFRERGAFKLENMHRQLLNDSYDAHFAQNDCEALLKICLLYGKEFVEYVDTHASKFPF